MAPIQSVAKVRSSQRKVTHSQTLLLDSIEIDENANRAAVIEAVKQAFAAYERGDVQMPTKSYLEPQNRTSIYGLCRHIWMLESGIRRASNE